MLKNIMKSVTKKGIPAVVGGAAAGAIHSAVDKYSVDDKGADMFGTWDWAKPFIPGLIGVVAYGAKSDSVQHGASAMIGYSVGTAVKPKADEMLSGEVLADGDFDEFFEGSQS